MAISTLLKKLAIATLGATSIVLGIDEVAPATVLTFDNVSTSNSFDLIPQGYGGFNWDNFYVQNRNERPGSGYDTGTVSGMYTAFNGFGSPSEISGTRFDFNSAHLTAAWNNNLSIKVEGLKNNSSLYTKTVVVNTTGSQLFDFNFIDIDTLKFTSFGGNNAGLDGAGTHFTMDNFTFNEKVASVPEPDPITSFVVISAFGASSFLKRQRKVIN